MNRILLRSASLLTLMSVHSVNAFTFSSADPLQRGWQARPLSFFVNHTDCPATIDQNIQAAFDVWNSVTSSSLKLVLGSESTQTAAEILAGTATEVPLIVCDTAFSADVGVDGDSIPGVGKLGGTSFRPITSGGLILNVEPGKNVNINNLSNTLINVVSAHEIGHVLGLGHSTDVDSLMYYDATQKGRLSLSQDDIDAITFLYPRNELKNPSMIGGCGAVNSSPDNPWFNGNSLGVLALSYLLFMLARECIRGVRNRSAGPKSRSTSQMA